MRLTRVYVGAPLQSGGRVSLAGSAAGHVTRVLRLRSGDALTVFDGHGGEYAARLEHSAGGTVSVAVGERHAIERESPLTLTLAQGVSRGERMDLVVQKATELGVSRLVPLLTERSVVRLDPRQAQRRLAHWRAIAVGACEQSGRNRLPELAAPQALADFLRSESVLGVPAADGAAPGRPQHAHLLLSPTATARIAELARPLHAATVLIGPEGGLTEAEHEAAAAGGFMPVRLGPRVLRTETAAIAALALLQSHFGDG